MWWTRLSQAISAAKAVRAFAETLDRLEIAQRRQALKLDALADDIEALSQRLSGVQGRLSGGGRGRPRKTTEPVSIDEIPHGDKAALRAYFLKNPPKDTEH